jgi:flavorubredoxin
MFTSVVPFHGRQPRRDSYLIRGDEPTLIDTGITPEIPEYDVALGELIDPIEI